MSELSLLFVLVACSREERNSPEAESSQLSQRILPNFQCPPAQKSEKGGGQVSAGIEHVFIVVLENADAAPSLAQPFLGGLAKKGAYFTNYHGLRNPSLPNYLALVAGDTFTPKLDLLYENKKSLDDTNLADLLEAAGKSWRIYAEDFRGDCAPGPDYGVFARRHVPFLYFRNVVENPPRCAKIVSGQELDRDLKAGRLPAFAFYIPNLKNDGHDTGVAYADQWLIRRFGPLLKDRRFMKNMLFIVTFDEDENDKEHKIYTAFLGDTVRPGSTVSACYTHYDLLRTIEEVLGLGSLGRGDTAGHPIFGLWR